MYLYLFWNFYKAFKLDQVTFYYDQFRRDTDHETLESAIEGEIDRFIGSKKNLKLQFILKLNK